jgi:long-chain acyl-CoA synthetase
MTHEKIWKKFYDEGIGDLDPNLWETNYIDEIAPVFEKNAEKTALYYFGVKISFKDLNLYSNRFADMLIKNGLKKGDVVGINLPNIPEYIIAWLGSLKAGCAVTGVSPLLSPDEIEFQLKDSNAKAFVTLDVIFEKIFVKIAKNLPELKVAIAASIGGFLPPLKSFLGKLLGKIPKGKVTNIANMTVYKYSNIIKTSSFSDALPDIKRTPYDIMAIMYTGGTTGVPKGAVLSHRNCVADILIYTKWMMLPEESTALSCFPFFHIAGQMFCSSSLILGWEQILIPNPRDTKHVCRELENHQPEVIANVPSLYYLLMSDPKFKQIDHFNLNLCVSGAAPFPAESMKALEKIIGKNKIAECYGMSETSPLTTSNPAKGYKKLGSVGMPLPNTDIELRDPATGKEVALGEAGEICVKGPQVMTAYHNKPEETEKIFYEDGYLRTGDIAVSDEKGYLTIIDRLKDMIIVGGFKVFSSKVEAVMSRHPAIDIIAFVGIENPKRPGSEIVKAFVQLTKEYAQRDHEEVKKEILRFAKEKLAKYEAPKEIEIMDEIPLTTVGKLDKKALRDKGE